MDHGRRHLRRSARGLIIDEHGDILLVSQRTILGDPAWGTPGGGIRAGESLAHTLTRELHEELGVILPAAAIIRTAWVLEVELPGMPDGFTGVREHVLLVRVAHFSPRSPLGPDDPAHPLNEGIVEARWWSLPDLQAAWSAGVRMLPADLPIRIRHVLHAPGRV